MELDPQDPRPNQQTLAKTPTDNEKPLSESIALIGAIFASDSFLTHSRFAGVIRRFINQTKSDVNSGERGGRCPRAASKTGFHDQPPYPP